MSSIHFFASWIIFGYFTSFATETEQQDGLWVAFVHVNASSNTPKCTASLLKRSEDKLLQSTDLVITLERCLVDASSSSKPDQHDVKVRFVHFDSNGKEIDHFERSVNKILYEAIGEVDDYDYAEAFSPVALLRLNEPVEVKNGLQVATLSESLAGVEFCCSVTGFLHRNGTNALTQGFPVSLHIRHHPAALYILIQKEMFKIPHDQSSDQHMKISVPIGTPILCNCDIQQSNLKLLGLVTETFMKNDDYQGNGFVHQIDYSQFRQWTEEVMNLDKI